MGPAWPQQGCLWPQLGWKDRSTWSEWTLGMDRPPQGVNKTFILLGTLAYPWSIPGLYLAYHWSTIDLPLSYPWYISLSYHFTSGQFLMVLFPAGFPLKFWRQVIWPVIFFWWWIRWVIVSCLLSACILCSSSLLPLLPWKACASLPNTHSFFDTFGRINNWIYNWSRICLHFYHPVDPFIIESMKLI